MLDVAMNTSVFVVYSPKLFKLKVIFLYSIPTDDVDGLLMNSAALIISPL